MNQNNIKNIIFDLGGVILDIDYNLTIKAFEKLGIKNAKNLYSQKKQTKVFDLLETGKITEAEFCNILREITNIKATNKQIIEAWNAMLLDFYSGIFDILQKVKKKYKTFLLSNTNIIHYKEYIKKLENIEGTNTFNNLFDKQYLSHEIGLRKPDPKIFKLIIEENKIIPNETLFIDDSIQHINGAKKVGLQAHWLSNNNLKKFLEDNKFI